MDRTRASSRGGSGRGPCAKYAHRQTHQCRVSHRSLDPAGQHHDAGAGGETACAETAGGDGRRPGAVIAAAGRAGGHARRGEEATGAETATRRSARVCAGFNCPSTGSRRVE